MFRGIKMNGLSKPIFDAISMSVLSTRRQSTPVRMRLSETLILKVRRFRICRSDVHVITLNLFNARRYCHATHLLIQSFFLKNDGIVTRTSVPSVVRTTGTLKRNFQFPQSAFGSAYMICIRSILFVRTIRRTFNACNKSLHGRRVDGSEIGSRRRMPGGNFFPLDLN